MISSWNIHVSLKNLLTSILIKDTQRKNTQKREAPVNVEKELRETVTSQGMPRATRTRKRQRMESPLKPLEQS